MCGRGSLTKVEKDLEARFGSSFYSEDLERYNPLPSFNIAPTQWHPVILQDDPEHFHYLKWGLIPSWAKDAKIGSKMINARSETLLEKPVFKSALKSRRCLIPFDGFYEWKLTESTIKKPYRIKVTDVDIFALAGLFDRWKNADGSWIGSFTIITQEANEFMKQLHDRMPAILRKEQERMWLDQNLPVEQCLKLIEPYPDDLMIAYPVSLSVNNVRNNDATLIEEVK
ncbi:MAG: SOS response-associated peptidase [Bacteroidota bacterium]|nr:SOS response-associated peptidase [Bacteroidota bacterium]